MVEMKHALISVGCLLVGLMVGYWIPDESPEETGSGISQVRQEVVHSTRSSDRPTTAGFERSAPDRDPGEVRLSSSGWVSVPTEFLQELSSTHAVQSSRSDLFGNDAVLLNALGISEGEKESLERHWAEIRQEVQKVEVRESRALQLDDGSVEIKIPDLSRVISPVGDDFQGRVEKVIGKDRASVLMAVKKIDQALGSESGERRYHIAVEAVGDGDWRYHMTYEAGDARRVWVGESVPNEIRHITDAARVTPSLADINEGKGR